MRDGLRASAERRKKEWEEKVYADGKRCPGKIVGEWMSGVMEEKKGGKVTTIMVKSYPLIPLLFFLFQEQAKKTLVFALWRLFCILSKEARHFSCISAFSEEDHDPSRLRNAEKEVATFSPEQPGRFRCTRGKKDHTHKDFSVLPPS